MDCEKVTDINDDEKDVIFSSVCSSGTPFKKFVPAKAESILKSKKNKCLSVSGTEIKNSYINIIGDDAFHSASNSRLNESCKKLTSNEKTKSKCANVDTDINVNILMKAVETNNVSKVTELLKINKDFVLNIRDQYGWTALMCACCAGAKDVVQLLLTFKPDLNITDKAGNTCLSLAKSKGNKCIVSLLNTSVSKIYKAVESKENPSKKSESLYCETCKETVLQSMESHLSSTVHLFNSSRKTGIPTAYGIPESNVGFQMLLKTGWDREKGLGPEGSGHKFPPKTVLKQDRAGLGAKKYSARVTHDPHLVAKERTERQKTLNRRERIRNELKNKRKEQELRRALD